MARFSQNDIDHIVENIDIVSLVSEYVKLESKGKNYIGLCPFHNEKTPSFTVSPEKKIAHCFGCGKGGNIFSFLSEIENISYPQAVVKLGSRLGLSLGEEKEKVTYNLDDRLDTMYYSYILATNYYNFVLLNTKEAEPALNYLLNRGLSLDSIKHFNLGYAPASNNLLVEYLKKSGVNLDFAREAGLVGLADDGTYYDVFKDRVVFPIKDDKARIVAFSGRTMSDDKSVAKYYNTHETDIFEKRYTLYNLSDARSFIRKENNIILVEGYMDVIRAYQENVKNVVAIMGTNLDSARAQSLLKITDKITLALDNDSAGKKACLTIGNELLKYSDNIFKINISSKKDIDEFVQYRLEKDAEFSFRDYVDNNISHFIEWKIKELNSTSKNIENKINFKNEILKNISYLSDATLKDILVGHLSTEFEIDKKILSKELLSLGVPKKKVAAENYRVNKNEHHNLYKKINYDKKTCRMFKYFLESRDVFLEFYEDLEQLKFTNQVFEKLVNNLVIYYNNNMDFQLYKFINNLEDVELKNLINYIDTEDFLTEENISIDIVRDYVEYFKSESQKNRDFNILKNSIRNAEIEDDREAKLLALAQLVKYKK